MLSVSEVCRVQINSLPQLLNALHRSTPLFNALQCHNYQVGMFESDRCSFNTELRVRY